MTAGIIWAAGSSAGLAMTLTRGNVTDGKIADGSRVAVQTPAAQTTAISRNSGDGPVPQQPEGPRPPRGVGAHGRAVTAGAFAQADEPLDDDVVADAQRRGDDLRAGRAAQPDDDALPVHAAVRHERDPRLAAHVVAEDRGVGNDDGVQPSRRPRWTLVPKSPTESGAPGLRQIDAHGRREIGGVGRRQDVVHDAAHGPLAARQLDGCRARPDGSGRGRSGRRPPRRRWSRVRDRQDFLVLGDAVSRRRAVGQHDAVGGRPDRRLNRRFARRAGMARARVVLLRRRLRLPLHLAGAGQRGLAVAGDDRAQDVAAPRRGPRR